MSLPVEAHRLRIAFDLSKYGEPVVEKRSAATPQIWRGNDLRIEVVIMDNGVILPVSNLASLTFEVRDAANLTDAPLMQKTVSSGDLDNTVTADDWEADTKEHAVFEFTDTETNLASPGAVYLGTWEETYYIVLHGVTTGGNIITYQTGALIFREDGSGSAGTPPTNDPNYYTMGQVDAAFLAKAGGTMTGKITLDGDPTAALHAATKQYVDAAGSNVGWKRPVRVASTGNVTISGPGAAIDGVTLSNGDRVLLKDQSTGSQNGIYVFNGAAAAMTRAADANTDGLMEPGLRVAVNEGTANADRCFMLTTNASITVGTTSLTFTQVSALGQVTLPAGLTKTSNEVASWHASTHATPAGVDVTTDGSNTTPAIARSTDLNTGLYFPGADQVALSAGGTARVTANTSGGALTGVWSASTSLSTPLALLSADGSYFAPALARSTDLDTGLYFPTTDVVALTAGGVSVLEASATDVGIQANLGIQGDLTVGGATSSTLSFYGPNGTAAAPAYSFTSEQSTGAYRAGAGQLAWAVLGTQRALLEATGLTLPNNLTAAGVRLSADGAAATPSLARSTDLNTGLYFPAADQVALTAGGTARVTANTTGAVVTGTFDSTGAAVTHSNDGAQVTTIGAHSDTTSLFPTLRRRKSRSTQASPNSLQSLDTIARDEALGFGGAAYQTAWRQDVIAAEAFGASAAGADVVWSTCPAGSATLTERMRLTSAGNWLYNGAAAPASLVNGHVLANGTAPSADPTNAAVIVPVSGELQYRTAAASEGAGQNNRLHNRGAETEGSGTDTLTGSFTDVDFGAGALTLTLPAGTAFQVFAMIEFAAAGGAAESWTGQAQLVRGTSTIVINPHTINIARDASFDRAGTLTLMGVVTGIGNATLKLQAQSSSGLTISRARIGYVRLY